MLGGLYSYFFGTSEAGEYQKAEEKVKQLQAQVRSTSYNFLVDAHY